MGGGLAMRAAAKAAGIGVLNGVRSGENPVASAARNATRSVSAAVANNNNNNNNNKSDDLKLSVNGNDLNNKSVEKLGCFDDEWDFAGDVEDELFMEAGEPRPRLVFGGAPTIFEAKQATSDLNDALKKTYLSPNAANGQKSDLEHVETAPPLVTETLITPIASKHALQAFRLLNENPKAQTVVASIACDPNVWNAVMQNPDLVDFLQSHKTDVVFPEMDTNENGDSSVESPEPSESVPVSGKGFMDYIEDIKQKITVSVVDLMNSLSDTFQTFFGGSPKDGFTVNPDGSASIPIDKTIGASLMGLAIMVITVVVLKRPAT